MNNEDNALPRNSSPGGTFMLRHKAHLERVADQKKTPTEPEGSGLTIFSFLPEKAGGIPFGTPFT